MEVTPTRILLVIACIGAAVALLWSILVPLHTRRRGLISESTLISSLLAVLVLNAEAYLLSLVPIARPLDGLPLVHVLIVGLLIAYGLTRYGLRSWQRTAGALACGVRHLARDVHVVPSLALVALLVWLGVFFVYGMFTVPGAWDALEYHVPMAVQPYQDGRIGDVTSDLPWPNAYPRGVEIVWYWTLQWTGTDLLFHPVLLLFGGQLLLAIYVLARRTGVKSAGAVLAMIVIGTTPVFYWLSTHGYVDIAVAASVVALVALLAPRRGEPSRLETRDWLPAAMALAEACLVKLPILAVAFGGIALLQALFLRGRIRTAWVNALRWAFSWRGGLAAVVVAASCHTYWGNWIEHGNPLYPARITIGERVVLDGPVDTSRFGDGGATSVDKRVADMTRFERFYHAWTDFKAGLLADSFGTFGPVLPFLILPLFAIVTLVALARWHTWRLALVAMFVLCYFTPAFLPRYGIPMVTFAVVMGMVVTNWLPRWGAQLAAVVVVVFCWPGFTDSRRDMKAALSWIKANSGGTLTWAQRDAFMAERFNLAGNPVYASPEITRLIRERSGPGDVLVWNVRTFPTLLYNRSYSNRVVHLPGTPRDCYPDGAYLLAKPNAEQMAAWLKEIDRLHPRHVLVYTHSAYAERLQSAGDLDYEVHYRDPKRPDRSGMTLFERMRD